MTLNCNLLLVLISIPTTQAVAKNSAPEAKVKYAAKNPIAEEAPKLATKVKTLEKPKKSAILASKTKKAAAASARAHKVWKKVIEGGTRTRTLNVRTGVIFRRPKTLALPRNPKYPRKSEPARDR